MKKTRRVPALGPPLLALLLTGTALAGCSPSESSEQEGFAFSGETLSVVNENTNMPVTAAEHPGPAEEGREVVVEVRTQTRWKPPATPDWSMSGDTLDLGTPCDTGSVGYCEGSFSLLVPEGTEVLVDGAPIPVG